MHCACVRVSVCGQWTTDQDILAALRRAGYGTVRAIKMYENRGNGQFKGWVSRTHFRHSPPLWLTPPAGPALPSGMLRLSWTVKGKPLKLLRRFRKCEIVSPLHNHPAALCNYSYVLCNPSVKSSVRSQLLCIR